MTPRVLWEAQADLPTYTAPSLEIEGFLHCTAEPEKLEEVANRFYRDIPGSFIIACIEPARVEAELRWEPADNHLFPHIYGPLNRSAVQMIIPFPRDDEERFVLPPELRDHSV